MIGDWLDRHIFENEKAGWRGPLLAAFIALFAGLPGAIGLPALDRDEARFAEATAQMLETGDFVSINYQDQPREKKPVGIHWLQAAAVTAMAGDVEDRVIFPYRVPSLLGAMLAAAACAWGAAAFFGRRTAFTAGAILGASFLLSTEAGIAKTDAVLCGTTTLAMAAFARLYAAAQPGGPPAGRWTRLLLWLGLAVALLDKGPVGPMVFALAALMLWAWDRKAPWARQVGWVWGLILVAAIFLPWAFAITVTTDGGFWTGALGGDLAPKLKGGQEGHGAPFGLHTLLSPFLMFPSGFLLPAAGVAAWVRRREPGVRFALCWLIPTWLVFELLPTKLIHYELPAYGALAWLIAAGLERPLGRWTRWSGAVLALLAGGLFAAVCAVALAKYGGKGDLTAAALAGGLFAISGFVGALFLIRRAPGTAILAAGGLGVLAHAFLAGGLAPRLDPLWLSKRTVAALDKVGLNPRGGLINGPVEVVGFAEPSIVFGLGAETGLGDAEDAVEALSEGRPAVVEKREQDAFAKALAAEGVKAIPAGSVDGVDYSNGQSMRLFLYAPDPAARAPATPDAAPEARP